MKSKILQSNAAYTRSVERLLAGLAPAGDASLNRTAPNGGWSAIQTMHHLILSEEMSLQYVRKKLSFSPKLEKAGLAEHFRAASLWFYLNLPIRFKAPAMVSDEHLPGFTSFADTRDRWLNIRREWTSYLEQLSPELLDKSVYRHPIVGRLGWTGMLKFYQYHFDRHRKQIFRGLGQMV